MLLQDIHIAYPHIAPPFHNHVITAGATNVEEEVPGFLHNGLLEPAYKDLNLLCKKCFFPGYEAISIR
jgi:hypothetical protein